MKAEIKVNRLHNIYDNVQQYGFGHAQPVIINIPVRSAAKGDTNVVHARLSWLILKT
jgi:hypothetical protein